MVIVGALMLFLLGESIVLLNRISSGIEQRELNDEPYEAALVFKYHVAQVQQFATDASAVGDAESLKEAAEHFKLTNAQLDAIAKSLPQQADQVAMIRADLDKFHATGIRMATTYIEHGQAAGNLVMKEPGSGFDDQGKVLRDSFDALFTRLEATNRDLKRQLTETEQHGRVMMVVTHVVLLLVVLGILQFGARQHHVAAGLRACPCRCGSEENRRWRSCFKHRLQSRLG